MRYTWACLVPLFAASLVVTANAATSVPEAPMAEPEKPPIESTNTPAMGRVLGQESEICVNNVVEIMTYEGTPQPLVKGELATFYAPGGQIIWHCGDKERISNCPRKTNYIVVEWASAYAFSFVCRRR